MNRQHNNWKKKDTTLRGMNMKSSLLATLGLALMLAGQAQDQCGHMKAVRYLSQTDPSYSSRAAQFEKQLAGRIAARRLQQHTDPPELVVPVVFHIVWRNEQEKLSEHIINLQLARLNEDYRNANYDTRFVPAAFQPRIGTMNIRFVLAQTDPDNRPTNGITYTFTTTSFNTALKFNDPFMKYSDRGGIDAWDPELYLNIWVCDLGNELNGYSSTPEQFVGASKKEDGVVVSTTAFGIHPYNKLNYNFGRTLVHEIGHWLGLKHTWADDDEKGTEFCTADDGIDDTPIQAKRTVGSFPFSYRQISCSNGPQGDMWMNFMDYAAHLNRLLFTLDQVTKARTVLETTRAAILDSKGLKPPTYNQGNTMAFRAPAFTSIAFGKDGYLWAGTDKMGLYRYNFNYWTDVLPLDNRNITQLATDKAGGIWVAQMGYEADRAIGGGINHFPDTTNTQTFYSNSASVPSRRTRGIFADTSQPAGGYQIWSAHIPEKNFALQGENVVTVFNGGGVGFKPFQQSFQKITTGLNPSNLGTGTFVAKVIGGNQQEVWVFEDAIAASPRIVCYNAATRQPTGTVWDASNTAGALPASFFVNCIYFDQQGNKWLGLNSGGLAYRNSNGEWKKLPLPAGLPATMSVSAIVGDYNNQLFIGTDQGLLVVSLSNLTDASTFKQLLTEDGLASDRITALAVDEKRQWLAVATDNGISLLKKNCLLQPCEIPAVKVHYTVGNGSWNNPAIWHNGEVPACGSIVVIQHTISVPSTSRVGNLDLKEGTLRVEAGAQFVFCNE